MNWILTTPINLLFCFSFFIIIYNILFISVHKTIFTIQHSLIKNKFTATCLLHLLFIHLNFFFLLFHISYQDVWESVFASKYKIMSDHARIIILPHLCCFFLLYLHRWCVRISTKKCKYNTKITKTGWSAEYTISAWTSHK